LAPGEANGERPFVPPVVGKTKRCGAGTGRYRRRRDETTLRNRSERFDVDRPSPPGETLDEGAQRLVEGNSHRGRHDELETDAADSLGNKGVEQSIPCQESVRRNIEKERSRLPHQLRISGEAGGFGKGEGTSGDGHESVHLDDEIDGGCVGAKRKKKRKEKKQSAIKAEGLQTAPP
jgi:hypothetical protein